MMNNTINEIKNSLEGINSRKTDAEKQIRDLEDKIVEITTAKQNKEKRMKRIEDSLRDLQDNIKRTNIRIIGVPEEEKKKKGTEKIFEEIWVVYRTGACTGAGVESDAYRWICNSFLIHIFHPSV